MHLAAWVPQAEVLARASVEPENARRVAALGVGGRGRSG